MPALTKAQQKQAQAAEDSFNRIYSSQYGAERWSTLKASLEQPTRYATLVNAFAVRDVSDAFTDEERRGLERIPFQSDRNSTINTSENPESVQYPLLGYERGSGTETAAEAENSTEASFPPPRPFPSSDPAKRLQTHWNLDAASLLAVYCLDVHPGDRVLDLCAAPGGKSIAVAQCLRPANFIPDQPSLQGGCLHSNELDHQRNKRLAANLQAYLGEALLRSGEVRALKLDGAASNIATQLPLGLGGYDKVLVDAPCSSERHVIHAHSRARKGGRIAEEMASWRSGHSKAMAKTQASLLMTALRAVKVGGRVVYATCSLSNDENDSVLEKVQELVKKERRKGTIRWSIALKSSDLRERSVEQWAEATNYGWIALPDHPKNGRWGPLFFAVLEKVQEL